MEEVGRSRGLEEQKGVISLLEAMDNSGRNIKNKTAFFSPKK